MREPRAIRRPLAKGLSGETVESADPEPTQAPEGSRQSALEPKPHRFLTPRLRIRSRIKW